MNDLTDYQRSILIAMLQGRDIQLRYNLLGWQKAVPWEIFKALSECPDMVLISPSQPEAVRLHGRFAEDEDSTVAFNDTHEALDTHYIDITDNGMIIGGKIGVER